MVWPHHDLRGPHLQWLLCIPPRKLGHSGLCHELHTIDVRSDLVLRRELLDEE
jgi:hypothetical protein